jgi:hypothetical protein
MAPQPTTSAAKLTPTRTLCIALMKTLPSHAGINVTEPHFTATAVKIGPFSGSFYRMNAAKAIHPAIFFS